MTGLHGAGMPRIEDVQASLRAIEPKVVDNDPRRSSTDVRYRCGHWFSIDHTYQALYGVARVYDEYRVCPACRWALLGSRLDV